MRQQPHARRLRRIYNGIDPNAFAPATKEPRAARESTLIAGFAGRLIPEKGPLDVLFHALAETRGQVSTILLVAGDGPERSRLAAVARDVGVTDQVHFLGMIDDIHDFWKQCDIAVIPGDSPEAFCMSALEAMACGIPVVATRSGALPELVVDGVTGILVPPRDPHAIARAITCYAQQPSLRRHHGAAARSRSVTHFHIDDAARAYVDLFRDLHRRAV
jgi:glycosyltransferase involved in cell wall biosynthesis